MYCDTVQGGVNVVEEVRDQDNTFRVVDKDVTRYFEIEGAVDVAERGRMTRMELIERDEGWIGNT